MTHITGPVAMTLLEKNNVRYLLIGDRHNSYNINGCEKNQIMVHEYLDKLFRINEQWDFYLEQGAYGIERGDEKKEFAKFLFEAKKNLHLIRFLYLEINIIIQLKIRQICLK